MVVLGKFFDMLPSQRKLIIEADCLKILNILNNIYTLETKNLVGFIYEEPPQPRLSMSLVNSTLPFHLFSIHSLLSGTTYIANQI